MKDSKTKNKRILFYYLSAFSHTGGIEKFNRCFIKALCDIKGEGFQVDVVSAYDNQSDKRYLSGATFNGFNKNRVRSVLYILQRIFIYDVIVLGHINLSVVGVFAKLLRPKCKLVLITHGIEVWSKLYFFKRWCLKKADLILAVSNYTKNQLILRNKANGVKIKLFPNTIDPFFKIPTFFEKPDYLLARHGLTKNQSIILTLSRLSSSEQYKGYDKVIESLPAVLKDFPSTIYLLAGKYDEAERQRIADLIRLHNVDGKVILTGFVADDEVPDYYNLADVFIMPSRKEGFGIVFLEALACGTPVIGGNQDGTVDALHNGSLGILINPKNTTEITAAVKEQLSGPVEDAFLVQQRVLGQYQFDIYKKKLEKYLKQEVLDAKSQPGD